MLVSQLATNAFVGALRPHGGLSAHSTVRCRRLRASLDAGADDKQTVPVPDTKEAAKDVRRLMREQEDAERQAMIAKIFTTQSDEESYLDERPDLIGQLGSAELLKRDEAEGFWPPELNAEAEAESMLWVDEYSCIGCTWCASVARGTFKMADEYGTAQVVQQGGDQAEVVEEAIDVCPSDCIYTCTRADLEVLEEYRALYQDDLMAKFYHGARMTGEGGGGGSGAAPHWRDPLVNTGWRQGARYVQSERLKAGLDDLLLHESGANTNASPSKANEPAVFPATGRNWPKAQAGEDEGDM